MQLDFMDQLVQNWRPSSPNCMSVPKNWTVPEPGYIDSPSRVDVAEANLSRWFDYLKEYTHLLSDAEVLDRCLSSADSWAPDFSLSSPERWIRPYRKDLQGNIESRFLINPWRSAMLFIEILAYRGGVDFSADNAIAAAFTDIPGCWLERRPRDDRHFNMGHNAADSMAEFTLVFDPLRSSDLKNPDVCLRISLLHPALLVGIKGSAQWGDERSYSHLHPDGGYDDVAESSSTSSQTAKTLTDIRQDLSQVVRSSLDSHVLNWLLAHTDHSLESLPPWRMVFGIIYDAEYVRVVAVVAHIPYVNAESTRGPPSLAYLSYLMDEIPYPAPQETVTVQFMLDRTYWPASIQLSEFLQEADDRPGIVPSGLAFNDPSDHIDFSTSYGSLYDTYMEALRQATGWDSWSSSSGDVSWVGLQMRGSSPTSKTIADVEHWLQVHPETWDDVTEVVL
ncbi:hypothetical protein EWM64_g1379 [Hericium alpestre]|uniref:Uncharacterized protein n=1 Tax=Hericium alpestre TaxID=135208 RepID=A0A4Z0A6G5_9AGAM|nr:hypothetical protein EWM64_g1379 [Hericium alpestre]